MLKPELLVEVEVVDDDPFMRIGDFRKAGSWWAAKLDIDRGRGGLVDNGEVEVGVRLGELRLSGE